MTRRTLITGGGGFVGSHIAAGLLALGDRVTALDQAFDKATRRRLTGAMLVEAPLTGETLGELTGFDLVIHGAALTTPPLALGIGDITHIKRNIDVLLDCLDYAIASGARRFVFVSSSGVFEVGDAEEALLESTAATARAPYSIAKRTGELLVNAACNDDFTTLAIRLGPIFGPSEISRPSRVGVSLVRRWLDHASAGEPIIVTSPNARRDWTYAPDVAPALDALLRQTRPVTGIVHFGSGVFTRDDELAALIAGLIPSAELSIEPDRLPVRAPMRSERAEMAALFAWTSLPDGLRYILAAEARA